jgi:cysteine-rich repeat protein
MRIVALAFVLPLAACSTEADPGGPGNPDPVPPGPGFPDPEPDPIGARISAALAGIGQIDADVIQLAHRVRQPALAVLDDLVSFESCQQVEDALWVVCNQLSPASCWASATFYWAHDIPRCSARLELDEDWQDSEFSNVYVIDFAGASRANPAPSCGDGIVDEGEDCDDGNLELWDGCDSSCKQEPFNGCETVIQQEYSAADIAWIDAATWRSPRSHLMVHQEVEPFGAVDAALCARATTTAQTVCDRLSSEMPFVSWCTPEVHLTAESTCDVRLRVQFLRPSPEDGVFTTALQGVLAFSIE